MSERADHRRGTAAQVTLRFAEADDPLLAGELQLRFEVLRDPLGLPPDAVRFPFENESLHLLALDGAERVLGCVLFHPEGDAGGRLYQMAVSPAFQGRGIGRELVHTLHERLRRDGFSRARLHARAPAVGFYAGLGYAVVGEPFVEVGIEHREMVCAL